MYYVKANQNSIAFFESIIDIVSLSLTHEKVQAGTGDTNLKGFFDQDIFGLCASNRKDKQYFLLDDVNRTKNILDRCMSHKVDYRFVSNALISSLMPPMVFDDTYCIHPLETRPFTKFRYKLARAQFLGFDPEIRSPEERLLKTQSGDILMTENRNTGFGRNRVFHLQGN